MKKHLLLLLSACVIFCSTPISAIAAEKAADMSVVSEGTTFESEHPPLSEDTKEAIGTYKRNPTEENKQAVLDALNKAYDFVIQNKKDNLEKYTQERTDKIGAWMNTVLKGGMPPFMSLSTDNNKGDEREAVADAVDAYRENSSSENRLLVKQALEAYYDAFLKEQEEHVVETEEVRESRIAASLEYFTSDLFKPQISTSTTVNQDDALAEIICAYISAGAEIVPVNPEARVREREINATISNAQMVYLNNPNDENLDQLKNEVRNAFQTAYDVRLEEYGVAEAKGVDGGNALFTKMMDADFRSEQFQNLTEQLNLYGRIDRMVTYGSNTYGDWTPRMQEESQELAILLNTYDVYPTEENKQAVEDKFFEIYDNMLIIQKEHLEDTQADLETFIAEILSGLIN